MPDPAPILDCVRLHQDDTARYYDAVRARGGDAGVAWDESLEGWIVTSYEVCAGLLRGSDLTRQRLALDGTAPPDLTESAERIMNAQLMFSDSEESLARRRYWTRAFQRNLGAEPDRRLEAIAEICIDQSSANVEVDVYGVVLQPFASRVAAAALGLSEEERAALYPLIWRYVRFLDGRVRGTGGVEEALLSIVLLYSRLGHHRRAAEEHAGYGPHEWLADFVLCLCAGHESAAYLLATVLTHHGGDVAAEDAQSGWTPVVREAVRFDSPVQLLGRRARTDLFLRDRHIRRGDKVYLHVGAANRDPAAFRDADGFRPDRDGPPPLSFGLGDGQCLGRSIAVHASLAFLTHLSSRGAWFQIGRSSPDHGLAGRGLSQLLACPKFAETNATHARAQP